MFGTTDLEKENEEAIDICMMEGNVKDDFKLEALRAKAVWMYV